MASNLHITRSCRGIENTYSEESGSHELTYSRELSGPQAYIYVLSKDLEFQRTMSRSSLCSVSSVHMRGEGHQFVCIGGIDDLHRLNCLFMKCSMSRKKSLKITKEQSQSVNRRGTMAKRNRIKWLTKIYKTLHRKLKIA